MAKLEKQSNTLSLKERKKANERQQMTLIAVVAIVVLAFIILVIVLISQANTMTVAKGTYSQLAQQTTDDGAPILGDPNTKFTIVEYADFSCPHCLEYHPYIQQIIDKYVRTGQARLIFRPETFVGGPYSQTASEAALCAGKQHAFWAMHDALFDIQSKQGPYGFVLETYIKDAARQLNLDTDQLIRCVINHETRQAVENSAKAGEPYSIHSTPSLLYAVDGQTFKWFQTLDPQTNKMTDRQGGGVDLDTIDQTIRAAYTGAAKQ